MVQPALKHALKSVAVVQLNGKNVPQTFEEHEPAACRVITTSLPPCLLRDTIIGWQRYQSELAQLFPPTLCETFAAVDACTPPLHTHRLTGENYTVSLSSAERERARQTIFTMRGYFRLWHCCLHLAAITRLHLVKICNAVQKYNVNRRQGLILT